MELEELEKFLVRLKLSIQTCCAVNVIAITASPQPVFSLCLHILLGFAFSGAEWSDGRLEVWLVARTFVEKVTQVLGWCWENVSERLQGDDPQLLQRCCRGGELY